MRHFRAHRLLSSLPDGLLTADCEAEVRAHAARCPLCERALRQLALSDGLLRRMPPELAPMEWTLTAETRLAAVAGALRPSRRSPQDQLALRAVFATAAVCALLVLVTVGPWSVERVEPRTPSGYLASAEREATLVAAAFEPHVEVVTN